MGAEYAVDKAADPGKASLIGAAVSGALGGLAADLAAGGLTFGAGAVLGGILGAAGARGLASGYNLARGSDATRGRWSGEFMTGRVSGAVLRYLAVAHFGRGAGAVVGHAVDHHRRAADAVTLVADLLVVHAFQLAAAAGDRRLQLVLRHVAQPRLVERQAQARA
jgi:hypothetical protein